MNRNKMFEEYLSVEAELIEIQDAITGMTEQTQMIVQTLDQEIELLKKEGDGKLSELEKQKNEIISTINQKIDLIVKSKQDIMKDYNEKINPIYDNLEKEIYPRKNKLYLELMGIPNVPLPEKNKIVN